MKKILARYNLHNIRNKITSYGFNYSNKNFFFQVFFIIGITLVVALMSKIQLKFIIVLLIIAAILSPFIIMAWFTQLYRMSQFSMLVDYLANIIPIFTQNTKIYFALKGVEDLVTGRMKEAVDKAIKYLENSNDVDMNVKALEIIEREFPNSRVRATHKLMVNIEARESEDYYSECEIMFVDIENWIKRVYQFQTVLKNRRNKLLVLCGFTLFMNVLFIALYSSTEYFAGFTSQIEYQISSTIFIAAILIFSVYVVTKLNGEWLINDLTNSKRNILIKSYESVVKGKKKNSFLIYSLSAILLACLVYSIIILNNYSITITVGLLLILVLTSNTRKYNLSYRRSRKAFELEYPVWLRSVSLNLGGLTVLNAIEATLDNVSQPMSCEIRKFLAEAKENPLSIKPYNDFLKTFNLSDTKASMKVLYSLQSVGKTEMKDQVKALITRNQDLLAKAEEVQNEDSMSGVEALGFIPMIVLTLQMISSLLILFAYMMSKLTEMMVF